MSRLGDDYFNTDGGEATPEIQIRCRRSSSCSSDTRENYQKPESSKYGNGSDLTLSNIDNEVNSRLVTLQISKTSLMLFSVGSKTLLLEKKINNISFCTKVCVTLHKKASFSIKDFFSKFDQIRIFRLLSHLLKKSSIENFIFCATGILGTSAISVCRRSLSKMFFVITILEVRDRLQVLL